MCTEWSLKWLLVWIIVASSDFTTPYSNSLPLYKHYSLTVCKASSQLRPKHWELFQWLNDLYCSCLYPTIQLVYNSFIVLTCDYLNHFIISSLLVELVILMINSDLYLHLLTVLALTCLPKSSSTVACIGYQCHHVQSNDFSLYLGVLVFQTSD